ncbi:aminoacyl tRNA synthase complex-interacting multifunctional protein 1 [Dorcoceras hygrometricum]|uniref:Aminoacyl tRNA synthase complex-interacting multifunctional protein 1 n=1 Tax=Dorcoceras hygrometricum TaxID=472368 RepID=A0A2Z7BKS1_9LAMI|nr:aminoacyl tRNA synthase complex-interacting multifunctional protein 1 [Dorcoceras hygrometricum]
MASVTAKQNIVFALCKYRSLDPNDFSSDLGSDVKSMCTRILGSSGSGEIQVNNNELMKWIEFAQSLVEKPSVTLESLGKLNEELITKSVLVGGGLKPSEADIVVFSVVHPAVSDLSSSDKAKLPHLLRWIDYIQNKEDYGELFKKILLEKVQHIPSALKPQKKVDDTNAKKTVQETKEAISREAVSKAKKSSDPAKVEASSQATPDKKKLPEKELQKARQPEEVEKKDEELSVSLLKIQIGLIRKAWKHPSADSLLVEEIDVGEAKCRQVVSGLAKYCTPDQLTNRRVVLITNVKPGKLRDVMSEGLVLCASNHDHSIVEPLIAPAEAKVGECVTFSGHDGKPDDVLNPKKKQLDKITPHLFSDDKGVATFKNIPFMTSSGPCTSSIPNASIK